MEGISSLLPLFTESSKSAAMMYHSMNIGKQAVQHLNPGQVPFITVDQPLFALAKKIQWNFPDVFGEDKFVVLLGDCILKWKCYDVLVTFCTLVDGPMH